MDAARQRLLAPGGGARSGGRGGRRQRRDKHAASQGLAQDATDMASTLSFFLNAQRAMHEDSSDDHLEEEMMVSLSKRGEYTSKKYPNTHPLVVQAAVEHARALQAHGTPLAELWRSDNFNSAGQLNRARFMQRLRTTVSASASSERRFVPTFEHVASDSGNSSALRLLASFALVEMTTERAKLLGVAALGRMVLECGAAVRPTITAWAQEVHADVPVTHGSEPSSDDTASGLQPALRIALQYIDTNAPSSQCNSFVAWLLAAADIFVFVAAQDTRAWPLIEENCKCHQLCERMDVKQEFEYWLRLMRDRPHPVQHLRLSALHSPLQSRYLQQQSAHRRSYLEFPVLLTAEVKLRLLRIEATYKMSVEYEAAFLNQAVWMEVSKFFTSLEEEVPTLDDRLTNSLAPYLILNIRRDHLIEDTFNALSSSPEDFHRPLKVRYAQSGEQGIDLGGVQKEFFRSVFAALLSPETTMFKPIAGNTLIWINAHTHEPLRSFYYFGVLVGLALYNSVNIRLNLPLAFYKQLLDRRADASDFRAMFPDLAHGLDQLLEYPGDVETDICSTYSVSDMYLGEAIEQPLIEGGNDIVVTNETRQQYVKDYIEFVLHKSMEQQMGAIRNGFMAVMAGWAVNLCTPAELQVMICGRDDIDLSTMKPSAAYIGYEESDDTIQHLWRFLDSLDDEGKRNFLLFVSGSARVPLGGLQSLHFTIQRAEHTNFSRLPTAMTCFNRLVLPAYPTEELLRQRVQTAIDNAQGFGLV